MLQIFDIQELKVSLVLGYQDIMMFSFKEELPEVRI